MIQMRVSAQEADDLLSDINNAIFQQGRESHWQTYINQNGQAQAPAQSICLVILLGRNGQRKRKCEEASSTRV